MEDLVLQRKEPWMSDIVKQAAPPIVTMGESMVLFWPDDGHSLEAAETYARSFGGAESNFAIAVARLGVGVRWISRLGDDAFGRYIQGALEREGIHVAAALDTAAPTAVFFKERTLSGPRKVVYYRRGSAASRLSPEDLAPALFGGARLLHLTGITPALSATCAAAVGRAIALAHDDGLLISVDPNVRLQIWSDAATCRTTLRRLMAGADLVLLGDEDAAVLFPGLDDRGVLEAVAALGPRTVVHKLGARGACAVQEGRFARVEAVPVTVADTVGAGDGFNAGFVVAFLAGADLEACLELGALVGAAAVSVSGDWEGYPRRGELDSRLAHFLAAQVPRA